MSEETGQNDQLEVLGDLLNQLARRVIRRGRTEIVRAADVGRRQLEARQMRKDLEHFWIRLGKTAHHLVEAGEIDHPALRKAMDRISTLESELEAADDGHDPTSPETLATPG